VSFRATAGQVYGLVGANGAGKTTLLKHLLGLLRATTGSVRVFGLDPVRDPVGVLSRVGYLSEERELPEWMRVDELMRYTQAFHPTWDASYARELLESFALDPSKKVKELSKGMRAQAGLIAGRGPSSRAADSGRALLRPRRGRAPRHPRCHRPHRGRRRTDSDLLVASARRGGADVGPRDVDAPRARDAERRPRRRAPRLPAKPCAFVEHFDQPPSLETALAMEGGGRTWSVVHSGPLEQFRPLGCCAGGEVVESRDATLEEIFLARAGRSRSQVEAA
jgi:ABC-2 type transport system ATP-binding protein